MYREEKIINGVLHWRSTPNGEWHKYSDSALTDRVSELAAMKARVEQAVKEDERADKDRIAALEAREKRLVEALKHMTAEFKFDDHNLAFPNCNCLSHQNYHNSRALLAEVTQ
jgi:hypothetical protein